MNFILRAVYIFLIKKILGGFLYIPKQLHFVKNKFFKFKIFAGLCHYEVHRVQHPTSFATVGSACGIATGEARLRREAKRLNLGFNLINYITCKTILV